MVGGVLETRNLRDGNALAIREALQARVDAPEATVGITDALQYGLTSSQNRR